MVVELQIGIDIGGTFTDVIATYGDDIATTKLPSTPDAPERAVFEGIGRILEKTGIDRAHLIRVAHGTTIATNAALERKGARVGMLTTAGFEDIIEIGRFEVSDIYDLNLPPQTPSFIAPRARRLGLTERLNAKGEVLRPLDEAEVALAVTELVEEHKVESIAVCLLFSFLNPDHERRVAEVIRRLYPSVPVSVSSSIDPRFREYERFTTTLFDAYLRPRVIAYLERVESGVRQNGSTQFQIMRSAGGLTSVRQASERAVSLLKSGLAGGVNGACEAARQAGFTKLISVDIGGTSCDVALVTDGNPVIKAESKLDTYPLRVPMIDVNTIGAGGGSVAWLDAAGGLHVGPKSAGSVPGPACYGRGGTDATVTDASAVLGYLNPAFFAGGDLRLDVDLAHQAVGRVATKLGLSIPETAWGIHRILNAAMTDEISKVSLQRGEDPRNFVLVLLGGGGPVHGCELARELGVRKLLVPAHPGLLAAQGLLVSCITNDRIAPWTGEIEPEKLRAEVERLDREGRKILIGDGFDGAKASFEVHVQARYQGQSFELELPINVFEHDVLKILRREFDARHARVYGRANPKRTIEVVSLRVRHAIDVPVPPSLPPLQSGDIVDAQKGTRRVYQPDSRSYEDVAILDRRLLPIGARIEGPAIIEQMDTTTVLPRDAELIVDRSGALVIELKETA